MAAEGVSSAEGSHRLSPHRPSPAGIRSMSIEPPEAGPGPATLAARRSRSRSRSPSHDSDADTYTSASEGSNLEDEEEDYERLRRERMLANASLLAQLDLIGGASSSFGTTAMSPPAPRRRGRPSSNIERYDRWGYVVSLPPPGKKQELAAIEIRTDRMTRRAIDNGEYTDCRDWVEGEDRRWRFGDGEGELQPGEESVVGGVGPDFRWKTYADFVDIEKARKMAMRSAMGDYTPTPTPTPRPEVPAYKKPYSELPEGTCHQCRRRSDKPKMQCRNIDPECTNLFCSTCCRRYNYFEFDEDSRSFICPVCMGWCNCKNCLDRRNLGDIAAKLKNRFLHKPDEMLEGETVQQFVERVGRKDPPFDRVRLVNMDEDIVAPPLTREWEEYLEEQRRAALGIKKRGKWRSKADAKGKKKEGVTEGDIIDGESQEVAQGKVKGGKGKGGKGKGGKGKGSKGGAPLRAILPAGEGEDFAADINGPSPALANANGHLPNAKVKKTKKTKKRKVAEVDTDAIATRPLSLANENGVGDTSTAADSEPSRQILLKFQLPAHRAHEVDSDGDSVRGYSSDEDLQSSRSRSPSSSLGEQAPESENINEFLARMASAVVPTLPALGAEQLSDAQLETMDVDCMPPLSMVSSRDIDLSAVDTITSPIPTSPTLGQVNDSVPPICPTADVTAHGQLRLTLAPAVGPTASLEALRDTPTSSRTPRRKMNGTAQSAPPPPHGMDGSHGTGSGHNSGRTIRFRIPQPSPPGQDPLSALYPSFPELDRSPYSSYASHSPSYPPSYSTPHLPYAPMYTPFNFTPSGPAEQQWRNRKERHQG